MYVCVCLWMMCVVMIVYIDAGRVRRSICVRGFRLALACCMFVLMYVMCFVRVRGWMCEWEGVWDCCLRGMCVVRGVPASLPSLPPPVIFRSRIG